MAIEVGNVFEGRVTGVKPFGAFVALPEGRVGVEIRSLQRYKALGNAIALPCADYIMAGIYEVLADRAGKEE